MSLATLFKAGAMAVALGAFVAPALAAPPPPPPGPPGPPPPHVQFFLQFGPGFGPGPGPGYGPGGPGGPGPKFHGNKPNMCLSDKQIYMQLQKLGFKNIKIWKSKGYQAVAVASWKGGWHQLLIDRCTGKITQEPMKKYKGFGNPGAYITLHFGN